jgi:hypothetical protein
MAGGTPVLYARIQSGAVVEFFNLPQGANIANYFNPALTWVNVSTVTGIALGWIATETNGMWSFAAPPAPPPPTVAQQAAAAAMAGWAVTSTSTPAINGTYAIDTASQQQVAAISLYIQVNARFPASQTTFNWSDVNGTAHAFPTTAVFQEFATAMADYSAVLDLIVAGASLSLPAQPTSIS